MRAVWCPGARVPTAGQSVPGGSPPVGKSGGAGTQPQREAQLMSPAQRQEEASWRADKGKEEEEHPHWLHVPRMPETTQKRVKRIHTLTGLEAPANQKTGNEEGGQGQKSCEHRI